MNWLGLSFIDHLMAWGEHIYSTHVYWAPITCQVLDSARVGPGPCFPSRQNSKGKVISTCLTFRPLRPLCHGPFSLSCDIWKTHIHPDQRTLRSSWEVPGRMAGNSSASLDVASPSGGLRLISQHSPHSLWLVFLLRSFFHFLGWGFWSISSNGSIQRVC